MLRAASVVAAVAVLAAACGDASSSGPVRRDPTTITAAPTTAPPPTPAATTPTAAAPTTSMAAMTTTTIAPTTAVDPDSVLQRRDVPPDGARVQFERFEGGGGICGLNGMLEGDQRVFSEGLAYVNWEPTDSEDPPPEVFTGEILDGDDVEMGFYLDICFGGFGGSAVDVEIVAPDGTVTADFVREDSSGDTGLELLFLPGDPLGVYHVTGVAGEMFAEGSFTLVPALEPDIYAFEVPEPATGGVWHPSRAGEPGTTFTFALMGYDTGASVTLYLYGTDTPPWGRLDYYTRLPPVQVGADGTAYFQLVTVPTDPPGTYCVKIDPNTDFCEAPFELVGTDS